MDLFRNIGAFVLEIWLGLALVFVVGGVAGWQLARNRAEQTDSESSNLDQEIEEPAESARP